MATTSDDKPPGATKSPSPPPQVPSAAVPQSQSQSPNPNADANAELQQIPQTRLPIKTYHCAFCNHLLLASTCDLSGLPRRREPARDRALILPLPKADAGEEDEDEEEGEEESEDENGPEAVDAGERTPNAPQNADKPKTKSKTKRKTKPESTQQQHYTILLSTTTPDRKPTMIRREDGFEKRLLLRCGRCRVVMGYALDEVHFADQKSSTRAVAGAGAGARKEGGGEGEREGEDGEGAEEEKRIRINKAEEVVYILPGALVETGEMGKVDNRAETEEWARWENKGK